MKIGYLVYDVNPYAGWGRIGNDLISGVKQAGHEVVILKEMDDGFDGLPILARGGGVFLSALRARKHLKTCDVVHALDVYPYGIIAFLSTLFLRKKIIITLVGTYSVAPLYNWKTALLSKMAFRFAAVITSISEFTKREVLKKVKLKAVMVITPGIDLKVFKKEHSESKEEFIISVGALKERKGYHNAIPAFALARREFPGLKYKIIGNQGDTNYFSILKNIAHEHGVVDNVEFLTNLSDKELSSLYREARLFLLPSVNAGYHFEGFGLVFLEAAAAGLPVIGTSGNGIEDAIENNNNGFLVPQNDVEATAIAIKRILCDSRKWSEMSGRSYSWASAHSLDDMIKRYLEVYSGVAR